LGIHMLREGEIETEITVSYSTKSVKHSQSVRTGQNHSRSFRGRNHRVRTNSPTSERPSPTRSEQARSESLECDAVQEIAASPRRFVGLAYSILRNREDAEDAVQDAILSAHRNSRSFQGRSAFGTWFTRIVLNAALMIYRKRKLSRIEPFPACSPEETSWAETTPDGRPDPEMLYAENETLQLIGKLLEKMSQPLRQAFTMVFYDELTIQEGAAQLGIAAGTFKTRVYRAKKYLINDKHLDLFGPLRKRTDSSFSSCTDDFSFLAKGPSATSGPEAAFS
jgi:RNA polymerase sigma factor (sigma-70 family)